MEITTRNRTELKAYFVKNAIPTEGQFAELIDGMLNLKEDGIVKLPNNPLCIKAVEDEDSSKNILHFYQDFEASKPNWIFNLDPNNDENKLGFNISDGEGNSRLFIDHSTGNVGIGTTSPGAKLDISAPNEGVALKVGRKSGKPSIKGAGDWLILDGPDSGKVGLNYWANGDIILVSGGGNVGIGTKSPEVKLDVNGTIKAKSLRIDGTNEDNHLNVDGAFYRYDGQVYLTVDDNLYIRDSDGSVTAHFNTNNGRLGIGKTNPACGLDVNGMIRATELEVNNIIKIGNNAFLHYGSRGKLGAAIDFDPDNNRNGLWLEASDTGRTLAEKESGGIFMNGSVMCLWSPGDNDILRVYDEDSFKKEPEPKPEPKFVIDNGGNVSVKGTIQSQSGGFKFPDNSIQSSAVKVQMGTEKLNAKIEGPTGNQILSVSLSGFTNPPRILVALTGLDVHKDRNLRIRAEPINISNSQFSLKIWTWADSIIYPDTYINWIAIGN